jgi:alkylation response protein AidB-like acyl-CoA dehydrogenase
MKWTDYQNELREAVRKWRELLSKNHIELDKKSIFSKEKWKYVSEMGLLGIPISEEYGGLGMDLLTTMYVLEELGYVSEDTGLNFVVSTHIVSTGIAINRFGNEQQKSAYLNDICAGNKIGSHAITEPNNGSDAFSMRTYAEKIGDKYKINGSKTFISNAPIADVMILYAVTDKSQGKVNGVTAFIIDCKTKGITIGKPIEKMGLKSAPMAEVYFDNCYVSENNVLGKPGLGFSIFDYVMKWEILCSFIINVGEMQRRFEKCVEYSKTRKQYNTSICKFQAIAHKLVEMKISIETSRDWLFKAAQKFQNKQNASIDIAIAKLIASESNVATAMNAIQIFGGYGYMTEYGIEKDLRQAIAGTIYSGTSEITRNKIANLIGI